MEKRNISIYWLIDKMITKKHTDSELNNIFNQALAMHKEEILDAWTDGYSCGVDMYQGCLGIDYYNETFGGNNETH